MRLWLRLSFAILLCLTFLQPVHADHVPRVVAKTFAGIANQTGPSAAAFDATRGLLFLAFSESSQVVVVRQDSLAVVRTWDLPNAGAGGTLNVALNGAGDRLSVLRTTPGRAYLTIFTADGGLQANTAFDYDVRPTALAMLGTRAYVARQGLPLLQFDGTLRPVTTVPSAALGTLTVVGDELAYFAPINSDTVNLVLFNGATGSVRTTAYYAPTTASYVVRATAAHLFVASCGGLVQIDRVTGAIVRSFGNEAIGCLTDVTVRPDGAQAIAIPVSFAGNTALIAVDLTAGTLGRRVEVEGNSGRLVGAWDSGRVYFTTLNYTTGQQSMAGVFDVASGNVRPLAYSISFAAGTYAISTGQSRVSRYDAAGDAWRTVGLGGTVTKTIQAPDGTIYAQNGETIARLRSGATTPDAFFAGGVDMVLDGATLYSHDGANVFASDLNANTSRHVVTLPRYQYQPGMAFDTAARKLIVAWSYQPRNALAQAGVTLVDPNGSIQNVQSGSAMNIAIAHDPVGHRLFVARGTFGNDGAPSYSGELNIVDLVSGAATPIGGPSIAFGGPLLRLAFDASRGLLAIADGANLIALDPSGRRLWTANVGARAIDVDAASWVVGGDNVLALVDPATGRVVATGSVGYALTDVGAVNDLVYGFDVVSGAAVSAQQSPRGLLFQVEAGTVPPTSWQATPTQVIAGNRDGIVSITTPHQGSGGRGNVATFYSRWARPDLPVVTGAAQRSWTWGPRAWATQVESYAEGSGGVRLVEYRDKTRMEITRPDGDAASPWYVTNGLLVQEMVSGQIQTGDARFEAAPCPVDPMATGCANPIPVAGDPDNNTIAPTYADLQSWRAGVDAALGQRVAGALKQSESNQPGLVFDLRPDLASEVTTLVQYDDVTRHNIPQVLWSYMTQRGPVYENGRVVQGQVVDPLVAFGRPITEPYWITARVGGETRDVLVQLFERRVLTYTPANPAAFQVEMGNVGQHYYAWRYGDRRW